MIEKVNDKRKAIWASLASQVWNVDNQKELIKAFEEGKYLNEYIYLLENEYVGFISLSLRNDYVEGTSSSPVGYIEGIYVKEEYRKKKIASKLIEFAKKWAKDNGCKELASDAEITNTSSIAFHQAVGFEEKNRIVCFSMRIK